MANLMAAHGATAMGRAVISTTPSGFTRLLAVFTAWQDRQHLRRLDALQRRDAGLADPARLHVAVHPGWDVRLQGLR